MTVLYACTQGMLVTSMEYGGSLQGLPACCRCDSTAAGNCSLPAGTAKAPSWTQMAPGVCALQYLNRSDKGFSNSPHLYGNRSSSGPSLRYWTGAHHTGRRR